MMQVLADLTLIRAWRYLAFMLALPITFAATSGQPQQPNTQSRTLQVPGGTIEVSLPDDPMTLSADDLLNWIKNSAGAVSTYYGRFPVTHLSLRIRAGSGSGVRHGVTYPTDGGLILITVGRDATTQALADDWVLTHEMIHLAFPSMADNHHWIEEGISTYVEPVARAQAGRLPVAEVWKEFIRDMPKGQPGFGDAGLDHTPTWGRTYWGGAMFCLLADVTIRWQTKDRYGLRDALRAIVNAGGNMETSWPLTRALEVGDRAVGAPVLMELYNELKASPLKPDLPQLWRKLGIETDRRPITFDDTAPWASTRRAIASGKPDR